MKTSKDFTQGAILKPMLQFAVPVLAASLLQSLYSAVDLMIVGRYGLAADVSGVNTGGQIMMTLTFFVTSFAMAVTILMGQAIGEKKPEKAGEIIGTGIIMFAAMALVLTLFGFFGAEMLANALNAPPEAFSQTVSYTKICSAGFVFIVSYNILGAVFRGVGDSVMPLISVFIASIFNVAGDLFFVAELGMGAAGAAIATAMAQALSVVISFFIIKRRAMPFELTRDKIRINPLHSKKIVSLGVPLSLQDMLVSVSFMFLLAITNSRGVIVSAGVGIAEKLCGFIMLVPSAFSRSVSAFVSQNVGAKKPERANKAMWYAIGVSLSIGVVIAWFTIFHGDIMCKIFTKDGEIIRRAWEYLKAYGIDTIFVCFLFCFTGYFNGRGKTVFTMAQNILGSFAVRIPVAYVVAKTAGSTIFQIGLATPISSLFQIILCLGYYIWLRNSDKKTNI